VHLNPRNPIWAHTAAVHQYATRVQSWMQAGRPGNDVLLYYPAHDAWAQSQPRELRHYEGDGPTRRLVEHMTTGGQALHATAFGRVVATLLQRGYAADYVSDAQLQAVRSAGPRLQSADAEYQVLVVPAVQYLPSATWERLLALAESGATVAFVESLPADVAGWHQLDARRERFAAAQRQLRFAPVGQTGVQQAAHGQGRLLLGPDLEAILHAAGVARETLVDLGLQTVRRRLDDSTVYYVVNPSDAPVDTWVPLAVPGRAAAIYDPATGRTGRAPLRQPAPAVGKTQRLQAHFGFGEPNKVRLQIEPHGSRLVRVYSEVKDGPMFPHWQELAPAQTVAGRWQLRFLDGGPSLPEPQTLEQLQSWTDFDGEAYHAFSGTASYTLTLPRPPANADAWRLDLGQVAETAQVFLNGEDLGITVGPDYHVLIPPGLWQAENQLEIRVANLGANRIAELDRRDPSWKKLYNQNIRPLRAANRGPDGMFTAAHWPPMDSGLLGPVTLTPLANEPAK
jgi:hypothetical protein